MGPFGGVRPVLDRVPIEHVHALPLSAHDDGRGSYGRRDGVPHDYTHWRRTNGSVALRRHLSRDRAHVFSDDHWSG